MMAIKTVNVYVLVFVCIPLYCAYCVCNCLTVYTVSQNKTSTQSLCNNFSKYGQIFSSLLHSK